MILSVWKRLSYKYDIRLSYKYDIRLSYKYDIRLSCKYDIRLSYKYDILGAIGLCVELAASPREGFTVLINSHSLALYQV